MPCCWRCRVSLMSQPPKMWAPSLCPTFEQESKKIWNEFGRAYQSGLFRSEKTITEDLLLAIQHAHPCEVITFPFRKRDEVKTGADWEWWLTNGSLWTGLLIQAKRLDPKSHKYPSIKHKVGETDTPQIDLLIDYANLKGIDPLYFFYNYSTSPIATFTWNCGTTPVSESLFGCTTAHALAVKSILVKGGAGLPKMSVVSLPMKCLVCCPVLGDPDDSLPGRAHGIAKTLRSRRADTGGETPVADSSKPRDHPPEYVRRLLSVPPEDQGAIIEELRDEVGPIDTLVIFKEKPAEPDRPNGRE